MKIKEEPTMYPDYEDEPPCDEAPCQAQANAPVTVTLSPFVLNDLNSAIVSAVHDQFKAKIERAVSKTLKQLVDDTVTMALEQQAGELIRSAITRPVQRTSEWGEPVGEPTSLMARLEEELRTHFYEKVDDTGKTEKSSYHRDRCKTRLEWMVKQHALVEVEKEAAKIVKEVGEAAKVKVREALADLISEKLAPKIRAS